MGSSLSLLLLLSDIVHQTNSLTFIFHKYYFFVHNQSIYVEPAYMDYVGEEYNLRQCQCLRDWKIQPPGTSICRCRGNCPSHVTPMFLTEAAGQALCSLESPQGYNCYAECENEKSENPLKWFALPCGKTNTENQQVECDPPILAKRKGNVNKDDENTKRKLEEEEAMKRKQEAAAAAAESKRKQDQDEESRKRKQQEEEEAAAKRVQNSNDIIDLRGLQCELLNGKEQCFLEDEQGRELCPSFVTSEYLSNPKDQYLCSSEMTTKYYCTAGCQEGNEELRWGAHEIAWCDDPRNKGSCPSRPPVVNKSAFKLKPWSAPVVPERSCQVAWKNGERPRKPIRKVTWGLLTHEPRSFRDSMTTYEKLGLFDVMDEFLIYINKRRPEVDAVAEEFRAKYPNVIKVMGDSENHGIARGMIYLTGNASNPYFLFLERDFQLIEPATCVVEQVTQGIRLLEKNTAHVVRYRHRQHPGRPNWAARMYRGHEDDVFKSGQPNLFCNHFYWYENPEKRWPDKMWVCSDNDPKMWCSDSYYCNWTNNPQLWSIQWWNKEYVEKFDSFKSSDPYYDLEMYMNWEPNSWNDRKWIVAQGDGLFKHVDRNNFGTF